MSTPGETLPPVRYELREPLGSGGMGQVYRAFDTVLRRDVALKLLRADLTAGSSGRARLLREARMAANLTHPNICTLYDVGEMDGRPFLTMELLGGETLRRRLIREPKVAAETAARIGRDVAAALAEAHGRGVIHRDIKPENIMLLPDGRVKVLDFGLAKAVDAAWSEEMPAEGISAATTHAGLLPLRPQTLPMTDEMLTTPGQIIGTYHYLSPEQADAKPADARSDVFSLGVVLYEMLAGARPFTGATAQVLLAAIRADKPVPLDKASPKAPGALVDVVQRCLKKSPGERYEGGAGVQASLVAVEKQLLRRTRMLWAAGVALIATLGVVAGTVLWRGDGIEESGGMPGLFRAGGNIPKLRRLTTDGYSGNPYFSPDGKMIAFNRFAKVRNTTQQAMVMSSAGGPARQVTDLPEGFDVFGWNVQGDGLLGMHGSKNGLWEVSLAGGAPRMFLPGAQGFDFDQGRRRIAYAYRNPGRAIAHELRVRDLLTGDERTLSALEDLTQQIAAPHWNNPGDAVAWLQFAHVAEGIPNDSQLLVQAVRGRESRSLSLYDIGIADGGLEWSAGDRHILLGARNGYAANLWMIPLEKGVPLQVTTGFDNDSYPEMDPAGKRVVFQRIRSSGDLVIAEVATGRLGEVFQTDAQATFPSFSLDGSRLLFSHSVDGPPGILSVPVEGGPPLPLSEEALLSCETPIALDPDRVAFVCRRRTRQEGDAAKQTGGARSIWVTPADGGPVRKLVDSEDAHRLYAADPSHGGRLLYSSNGKARGLRLLNLATGVSHTCVELQDHEFILSATAVERGGFVALVQATASDGIPAGLKLVEISAEEGTSREIAAFEINAEFAGLSRDEKMLAYAIGPHTEMEVWLQDLPVTGPPRQLTHFNGERHPHYVVFSPDGSRLAIRQVTREASDIYMLDGS